MSMITGRCDGAHKTVVSFKASHAGTSLGDSSTVVRALYSEETAAGRYLMV